MIIKSISADSFGKLKNKRINFEKGINVVEGANESGKSSLARFIRFMLYGFTSRVQAIAGNDKMKYTPWGEEVCKGSAEIERADGEVFTARREQAQRASHSITDKQGLPVFKGVSAGEAFLGVDEETFDKTALVSAGDVFFSDAVSLSSAIKNMVFSADSTVDSENALKKLVKLKKSILGKNGKSGRLYEARKELSESIKDREILAGSHRELLGAQAMLEKIRAIIQKNNIEIEVLEKERHNLDAYEAKNKIKKLDELRNKALESQKEYQDKCREVSFSGFLPDREFLSGMNEGLLEFSEAENSVNIARKEYAFSVEILKNCYADKKQFEFNTLLNKCEKKPSDLAEDIDVLKKNKKNSKVLAIILTVLIVTIPVAVFFWLRSLNISKQLDMLAKEFSCSSLEELCVLLSKCESTSKEANIAKEKAQSAKQNLETLEENRTKVATALCEMLEKSGKSATVTDTSFLEKTVKEQIKKLSRDISEIEEAENVMKVDKASLDSMLSSIADVLALEALANEYNQEIPLRDPARNAKELDFYVRANEGLYIQERDYEKKTAIISSNMKKPDELAAKIELLSKEIEELEQKNSALEMSIEAIDRAHESMRGNVSPVLTQKASELFCRMTGGKYMGLYVDNELKLSFLEREGAEYRSIEYLSSGAADAAYLCLRITLTQFLYNENPVLIFDDAFSRLDDERLKNVCEMLKELSQDYQIILLTCHNREAKLLNIKPIQI